MELFWRSVERGDLRRPAVMSAVTKHMSWFFGALLVSCGSTTRSPPEYVQDPVELDGKAFTLTESLCPTKEWLRHSSFRPTSAMSMGGFVVQQTEAGDLELVTFTRPAYPVESLPKVQVTSLSAVGDGFEASNVNTCAQERYALENQYDVEQYTAKRVHVDFAREADGQLSATLIATTPADDISAHAAPDVTAPKLLDTRSVDAFLDQSTTGLDQYFALSEPLAEVSQLGLVDADGTDVPFAPILSEGFVVGIHVEDVLSTQAHWQSQLVDLAGNTARARDPYPGIALSPSAGDFEEETTAFFTSDIWNDGVSDFDCSSRVGTSSSERQGEFVDLPALAGEQSLLAGGYGACSTFLRVVRPPGATRVVFDAREIHSVVESAPPTATVRLDSLRAGGDGTSLESSQKWPVDAKVAGGGWWVSTVQTLTFELPTDGDDFLMSIKPADAHYLWLDSLRFE